MLTQLPIEFVSIISTLLMREAVFICIIVTSLLLSLYNMYRMNTVEIECKVHQHKQKESNNDNNNSLQQTAPTKDCEQQDANKKQQ